MARSSEPRSVLEVLLTETALRLKAGPASYERGERYATTQRVKKLGDGKRTLGHRDRYEPVPGPHLGRGW